MNAISALLLQLFFASLGFASPIDIKGMNPNAQWGAGGGVLGFIILVLDIIVWIEVLKSNRPPVNKLLWCVLVFIFPIVGLIIYWLFSNRSAHNNYEPIG